MCVCTCGEQSGSWGRRPRLSKREAEVVVRWLLAAHRREVADALFIAESVVATHIYRVRRKYERVGRPAPTKAVLLVRALRDGLLTVADLFRAFEDDEGGSASPS